MNYLISNTDLVSTSSLYGSDDYIAHALNLQWGKHKYIRRTGTPGNYVYTYAQDLRNAGRKLVSNARSTARNVANRVGSAVGTTQRRNAINANLRSAGATARLNASMTTYDGSRRADRDFRRASRAASGAENRARDARIAYSNTPLGKAEQVSKDVKKFIQGIPDEIRYQVRVGIPYDVNHFINSTIGIELRRNVKRAASDYASALNAYRDAAVTAGTATSNSYFLIPTNEQERAIANRLDDAWSRYQDARRSYGKSFLGKMENLLNITL